MISLVLNKDTLNTLSDFIWSYKPFGISCDGFFLFTKRLMSNLDDEDDDDALGCCTNRSVASITVWPYNNSVPLLPYNIITLVDKYIVWRGANSKQE